MADKKDRERVIAEITLSHLMRLGNEQGYPVSREQALAFLNQEGRAFEMWKYMMQAAEEFIRRQLVPAFLRLRRTQRIRVAASPNAISRQCPAVACCRVHAVVMFATSLPRLSNLVASLYSLSATSEVSV